MKFRVASWNINSVRLRLALVQRFIETAKPDILCLQEIKCLGDLFPSNAFRELGFPYIEVSGQLGYHGVATISKLPLSLLPARSFCGTPDARYLGCAIIPCSPASPIHIHNLYIPAGGDIPDTEINPKFKQKLTYLRNLADWCEGPQHDCDGASILLGDLNVAPLETDVWSHKQLLKVVSHTPVEVEHLQRAQTCGKWTDVVRTFIRPDQKLFTWWSYRARDWAKSDRGRRLDHIWASKKLAACATDASVFKETRGWPGPSDHVPVIVDFEI